MLQQMPNTMIEMQAQMRQERQETHQERHDMQEEMRQERWERQQQPPLPPPPPLAPPWDKHRKFMSHKPPTFSSSPDPLHADDWLKSVEKMLNIAQCSDREKFRNYYIPAGLMKIKKKEFLSLNQGNMSVSEYRDKFIQLSRYASDEVADDERKQEHFMEGLLGEMKRKAITQGQGNSSIRPRYVPP
eukprot:XP_020407673.1 putative mediator of RNA polymerase II transcription subunit 21 [Zea mays]